MTARPHRRAGYSLLETLVVLAIIMVLFTLLVPVLTRALRMAKRTAAGEEHHQAVVGEMADGVHDDKPAKLTPQQIVDKARKSFRQTAKGSQTSAYSSLLYGVTNDLEFRAYWFTLLNPQNPELPTFTNRGSLNAVTPEGQKFELPPTDFTTQRLPPSTPIRWEFMSTQIDETGRGDLGGNVAYADGRIVYVAYPREFPMTRMVAELSHRFYMEVTHD